MWELPPGSLGVDYHFHHGNEEFLIVIRGTATLRTPEGERELSEGSVAHFSPGPGGAHAVMNLSDAPMRYVMIAAHTSPDIIEYPDKGEFAAVAQSLSQRGERFVACASARECRLNGGRGAVATRLRSATHVRCASARRLHDARP